MDVIYITAINYSFKISLDLHENKELQQVLFFMFENYVPLNDLKRYNCANEQLVILNILMAELRKFLAKVKVNWRKIGPYLGHYNSVRLK